MELTEDDIAEDKINEHTYRAIEKHQNEPHILCVCVYTYIHIYVYI